MCLAHDSLADPDHPLHIDDITGIQLYHGKTPSTYLWCVLDFGVVVTLESTGETRLCFSSAQIDYVRYWLYAMNLTKTLLPIPYSDCLIVTADIKNISTHTYPDGGSLRSAIKVNFQNYLPPLFNFCQFVFCFCFFLFFGKCRIWINTVNV